MPRRKKSRQKFPRVRVFFSARLFDEEDYSCSVALESSFCERVRDSTREYERERHMTHHMSLKDLRENSVTFDENNRTIKYYAKI